MPLVPTFSKFNIKLKLDKIPHFELLLWGIFVIFGLIGMLNHAMWRDELNGWLIAKYSANWGEFWGNIRYEGHPILWYICLYGLNQITSNPVAMQLFHLGLAAIALGLWIYFSPFTRLQKTLFTLGYLPIYEYLVISRNYAIGMLFLFAICTLFPTRHKSYLPLAIAIAFLANTNAYCLLISLTFLFSLSVEYLLRKKLEIKLPKRKLNLILSLIIVIIGIILSVQMLIPPSDANLQGGADQWFFQWDFHRFNQAMSRIWNSYILVLVPGDSRPLDVFIFSILSLGILGFCSILFWEYPVILTFYLSGSFSILLFTYLKFLGSARHYGHLYLILIAALWLKSYYQPSPLLSKLFSKQPPFFKILRKKKTPEKQPPFLRGVGGIKPWVKRKQNIFFTILLICQLIAGMVSYIRDLTLPYSASRETAHYIQTHHLNQHLIIGSEDFAMTPISGYLGQKIYYPEIQALGSFVLFNNKRKIVNDQEILNQAETLLLQTNSKPILLILNHPLKDSKISLEIQPIQEMKHSFIGNEQYYLYQISAKKS